VKGSRKGIQEKSVKFGLLVGQNEPPVLIGCHTQPSEQIADENRITSVALKGAVLCAGLGENWGRCSKGVVGRKPCSFFTRIFELNTEILI
jgi:hypothetical protein